uniref:Inositol polyphosphate-1-phosphatase n=1 Tax=Anas platyrhynchos platyrhynchos TaxID=8840 RepID=A0A493TU33_ANAPP
PRSARSSPSCRATSAARSPTSSPTPRVSRGAVGTGPPHHHRHHPRALGDATVVPAGETVAVRVCGTVGETAALLGSVLAPEQAAAELLAAAAHRDVVLGDTVLDGVALSIPPGDLAIWIDPIDSTNEYIGGREDVAPVDGISPAGLCSALVLIGAYDRRSGCPVLGVINEPFFCRDPLTHRWQGRYHWGIAYQDTRLCSLSPPPPPRPPPRVVLSRAEGPGVRAALDPLCGGRLRFAAGAGYKMLCVILGLADAYVLSEGSTFAWDACAPHAILRALGGGHGGPGRGPAGTAGLAMALEGGMKCVKFLVFIFNFIFWVSAGPGGGGRGAGGGGGYRARGGGGGGIFPTEPPEGAPSGTPAGSSRRPLVALPPS